FRFHVGQILLELSAPHAVADNIKQRQDSGVGSIDDALFEIFKVSPAGASGVGYRRHSCPECEAVGIDTVVARIGSSLSRSSIHVSVNVNKPGRDIQARHVNDLERLSRIDAGCDGCHLAGRDGHVTYRTDLVLCINDMAALQQQIVLLLSRGRDYPNRSGENDKRRKGAPDFQSHSICPPRISSDDTHVFWLSISRSGTRPYRGCPTSRHLLRSR